MSSNSVAEYEMQQTKERHDASFLAAASTLGALGVAASPLLHGAPPEFLFALGCIPAATLAKLGYILSKQAWLTRKRQEESRAKGGKMLLGAPPQRNCFEHALTETRAAGQIVLQRYLSGFDLARGAPLWIDDDTICKHAAVVGKSAQDKRAWLESLMLQQMARGRASGCTFIDAQGDTQTLSQITFMAIATGRIEDLIVIDTEDPAHGYNFVRTEQRADLKAKKVLTAAAGVSDSRTMEAKAAERVAADSIYRIVRTFESIGLSWSVHDVAAALSTFHLAYPYLRQLLTTIDATQALVELGHLASSYRDPMGGIDIKRMSDSLRAIASELEAVATGDLGKTLCLDKSHLVLSDAVRRGKIVYIKLPHGDRREDRTRMVNIIREDLEMTFNELVTAAGAHLEDPHLILVDECAEIVELIEPRLLDLAHRARCPFVFGLSEQASKEHRKKCLTAAQVRIVIDDNCPSVNEESEKEPPVKTATNRAALDGDFIATTPAGLSRGATGAVRPRTERESLNESNSYERGVALIDRGDGQYVRGRVLYADIKVPESWPCRDFLALPQSGEPEALHLASWVDEQILAQERQSVSSLARPSRAEVMSVQKGFESAEPGNLVNKGHTMSVNAHNSKKGAHNDKQKVG